MLVVALQIIKLINLNMKAQSGNLFICKSIVFYLLVLSILGSALGLILFRDYFYIFTALALSYAISKFMQMVAILIHVNRKYSQAMKSFRERQAAKVSCNKEVTHVFIIPNYNEDQVVLKQTLDALAKHTRANKYCIFLAMEHHEFNSQEKAQKFCNKYSNEFRLISYTIHHLSDGESKTKASNINWCARHFTPKLIENKVSIDSIIITIMDSDSIIPEPYVDQVQKHIEENYDQRHNYIYQPPQFFTRNQNQVAFFVRVIDNLMSAMHCSQHFSFYNYTLAVSNYSISYKLLERIDFWDTCKYSKGEDIRIASKALFRTNGESKTCPIYIPINQMSLSTHQGYWADFKARMVQAKRHAQDQTELSYNFVNMTRSSTGFFRKAHAFFTVCEVYLMPSLIPIQIIISVLQDVLQIIPKSSLDNGKTFYLFNNFNTVLMFIAFGLFEYLKRKASRQLYGIKDYKIAHIIQTPLLQLPGIIVFGFVPLILASFSMITDNITFTVAQKKFSGNNMSIKDSKISDSGSLFQPELEEQIIMDDLRKEERNQIVQSEAQISNQRQAQIQSTV